MSIWCRAPPSGRGRRARDLAGGLRLAGESAKALVTMDPTLLLTAHLLVGAAGVPAAPAAMQLREPLMTRAAYAQLAGARYAPGAGEAPSSAAPSSAAPWVPPLVDDAASRRRRNMLNAHRALELSTAGALAVTGALGVITAINRPTVFGDGRCATNDPIFGNYGCESLSIVHGISGVVSEGLYIGTMVLEAVVRDPPWTVDERPGWRITRRVLTWIHASGMILQPLLGMLSAYPGIIGINDPQSRDDFSRVLRVVHAGAGVVTATAFLGTVAIDVF